jgi:CheY-like chemotaxis protein
MVTAPADGEGMGTPTEAADSGDGWSAPEVVVVDSSAPATEELVQWLRSSGRHRVLTLDDPDEAVALARTTAADPPRAVVFDLSFPGRRRNGLDIIVAFARWCPESALVAHSGGSPIDRELLDLAWSALQPFSVIAKTTPLSPSLRRQLDHILETGEPTMEPGWRADLEGRTSARTIMADFERLVPDSEHAKLWAALIKGGSPLSYGQLGDRSGLPMEAAQRCHRCLLDPLARLGFDGTGLPALFDLAQLLRPLLERPIERRLGRHEIGV